MLHREETTQDAQLTVQLKTSQAVTHSCRLMHVCIALTHTDKDSGMFMSVCLSCVHKHTHTSVESSDVLYLSSATLVQLSCLEPKHVPPPSASGKWTTTCVFPQSQTPGRFSAGINSATAVHKMCTHCLCVLELTSALISGAYKMGTYS